MFQKSVSFSYVETRCREAYVALNICQKMNSERDIAILLDLIAHEATKLMDAERASIFVLDKEKNELCGLI